MGLTVPTFGKSNVAQPLADPAQVKITNGWRAPRCSSVTTSSIVQPTEPAGGHRRLLPDGCSRRSAGAARVAAAQLHRGSGLRRVHTGRETWLRSDEFKLALNGEVLALKTGDLKLVDQVLFGPQTPDVSQGRLPDGADNLGVLRCRRRSVERRAGYHHQDDDLTLVSEQADKRVLVPTATISDNWRGGNTFDDSTWLSCTGAPGGVGFEASSGYAPLISLDLKTQMYGSGKNTTCYIRIPFTVDAGTLPPDVAGAEGAV